MLLSKIQGTQALIHYIERSTTQLVEYKALNLMDVGSSPVGDITIRYDPPRRGRVIPMVVNQYEAYEDFEDGGS